MLQGCFVKTCIHAVNYTACTRTAQSVSNSDCEYIKKTDFVENGRTIFTAISVFLLHFIFWIAIIFTFERHSPFMDSFDSKFSAQKDCIEMAESL